MNFLPEKKYGLPSWNFVKKNVLCEKGDEITRFYGTQWPQHFSNSIFRYEYPKNTEFHADIISVEIIEKKCTQKKLFAKNFCKLVV